MIDQKENLEELLRQVLLNAGLDKEIRKNGLLQAKMNHDSQKNSTLIKELLTKVSQSV